MVAHGHTDSQVTKIKNNQIPWRLRILGKSKEDLPHECTLMRTGKCDHNEEQNYNLNIDVVSEYYVPNNKNLIGRLILKICSIFNCSIHFSFKATTGLLHLICSKPRLFYVTEFDSRSRS